MPVRYTVVVMPEAYDDAHEAYEWLRERTDLATTWYDHLMQELSDLETFAERGRLARESEMFGEKIYQVLFTKHASTYRILYTLDESSRTVYVQNILHGRRNTLRP